MEVHHSEKKGFPSPLVSIRKACGCMWATHPIPSSDNLFFYFFSMPVRTNQYILFTRTFCLRLWSCCTRIVVNCNHAMTQHISLFSPWPSDRALRHLTWFRLISAPLMVIFLGLRQTWRESRSDESLMEAQSGWFSLIIFFPNQPKSSKALLEPVMWKRQFTTIVGFFIRPYTSVVDVMNS